MSRCKWLVTGMVLTSLMFMGGCTSGNSTDSNAPVVQNRSTAALAAVIAPGAVCANGGIEVKTGIDTNGNGALDADEVLTTEAVCNGLNGTAGTNGVDGTNGTNGTNGVDGTNITTGTLMLITDAGVNDCANGGAQIDVGLDDDGDQILDAAEIDQTSYVCNGAVASATAAVETCTVCHNSGRSVDAAAAHAISAKGATVTVQNVTATPTGADITVKIEVDGVVRSDFGTVVAVASYITTTDPTRTPGAIGSYDYGSGTGTVVNNGDGTYIVSASAPTGTDPAKNWVTNGWWTPTTETTWMVRLNTGAGDYPEANIVAHATADGQHLRKMVSNEACINCHGTNIFKEQHASRVYHNSAYSVQSCVTCHTSSSRSNLMAYAHGIHNSHNMAERSITSGTVTVVKPAGVYARNNSTSASSWYEVTYPTYMNNCSVCHSTPAQLAAANDAPVSYALCISCHDSWAGFGVANTGTEAVPVYQFGAFNHAIFTASTDCSACHNGSTAPATVKGFHNGLLTERSGLIWDGRDVSVDEGAKIDMQFTGITRTGDNLAITWTATYAGTPVDPCNTTATATAPTWQSGFSILRAYVEGDDFTNNGIGTSPGQPVSTNLSFTGATPNTVCAGNIATTTVALTPTEVATTATKGSIALQGKPQIKHTASDLTVAVRAKTPTRDFVVATGAQPTTARRAIVDTAACLKCHVGSLYQHGGNRIDNVDMCVLCHNEASSEQSVRTNDGVDASEAYDGQAGQTYGFKSFLHAVHSSGETGKITMIYRTNGVYVWAGEDTVIPNWPGTGLQTVYGSKPSGTNPNGTARVHNLHSPTYPRRLNDCAACHKANTTGLPDQSIAVATTIDAGVAPWGNGNNDTLEGASAAACMSCHQSGDSFEQAVLKNHAYQNGWVPSTFPAGRQTLLDAVK